MFLFFAVLQYFLDVYCTLSVKEGAIMYLLRVCAVIAFPQLEYAVQVEYYVSTLGNTCAIQHHSGCRQHPLGVPTSDMKNTIEADRQSLI